MTKYTTIYKTKSNLNGEKEKSIVYIIDDLRNIYTSEIN